jgi:hypothetical protein
MSGSLRQNLSIYDTERPKKIKESMDHPISNDGQGQYQEHAVR